jgi:dTDP-4-dehydrorhamnose reductase
VGREQAKPKILVTGCNGLLGQKVTEMARPHYWTVGIDLQDGPLGLVDEYVTVDISQRETVLGVVEKVSPVAIVNTAALTNVDACERDRDLAWKVNVDGVRFLLEAGQKEGSSLVHISSDYVFDGEAGPYHEDADPKPIGFYGVTKLESERLLTKSRSTWAIVRTNVLYGWANGVRLNFALWVRANLSEGKYIRTAVDQYGNPTLASSLAEGILCILMQNCRGIYHIAGADYLSRWAFAVKIAEAFQLDQDLITPVVSTQLSQRAPRPHWGGLITDRTAVELGISMIDVQTGLETLKRQIPPDETEVR